MPKFLRVLGVLLLVLSVLSFILVSYARDFSVLVSGMLSFGLLFAAAEVLESLRAIKSAVCASPAEQSKGDTQPPTSIKSAVCASPASAHNASASSAKVIGKKCLMCGRHFPATVDRCPYCNADMFQKIYDEKN
nr:MAG TPA: zinc-ribbon containing domain protein [Caudoviricetes sp.]